MDISLHGELNRTQLKQLQTMLANGELPPAKQQRLLQRIAKTRRYSGRKAPCSRTKEC
ncbi:Uncharacterised protein [Escherichia coli]|nr:Uncharacterised protein [Escherichia coli]